MQVLLFVAGPKFGEDLVFVAGAVLGDGPVSLFVAGAKFGEDLMSLFVAGAVFCEDLVSLFVAGSAPHWK